MSAKSESRSDGDMRCPACGGALFDVHCHLPDFRYGGDEEFSVVACRNCNHVFTTPQLSWAELKAHYPESYYTDRPSEDDPTETKPTHGGHRLDSLTAPKTLFEDLEPGRVLEVGCGTGEELAYLHANDWEAVGLEPSETGAKIAREEYDLHVVCSRFEEATFEDGAFDLVVMDNVLEHLHNPFGTLDRCQDLLATGGHLVVEVPNIESLGFKVFGRYWNDLDVPRHLHHFSPSVLRREAEQRGFEQDAISYTGYPLTLRYSLNRLLDNHGLPELGRWTAIPLLPISLLGRAIGLGDHFRVRYRASQ